MLTCNLSATSLLDKPLANHFNTSVSRSVKCSVVVLAEGLHLHVLLIIRIMLEISLVIGNRVSNSLRIELS